jgi:ribosomal-protein-alanine N-acetyltransferase
VIWPFARAAWAARSLRPADADACARLHKTGFAHPWSVDEFESLLASRSVLGSGAAGPGASLRGFALSRFAADEAEVLTVVVAPAQRRHGLGLALMTDQIARLTAAGVRSLALEVDERNVSARALYARLGFSQVGRRPAYYRLSDGRSSSALVLRVEL